MVITVRSQEETDKVIAFMKKEGFEYKYSIFAAQEWYRKEDNGTIIIRKTY